MLHELLMALLGHTGSLIINKGDQFALAETLDFMNMAEKELVSKLLTLGWEYKKIINFITMVARRGGPQMISEDDEIPEEAVESDMGIYVRALCYGIEEILKMYREYILAIEHEFLLDRALTIPHLLHRLGIYFQVLPALSKCISAVSDQGIKGGQLLDLLYELQQSGNPAIQKMFTRLVYHCLKVLYEQINAWTIYGIIMDDTEEFFIERVYSGDLSQYQSDKVSLNTSMISAVSSFSTKPGLAPLDIEVEEWNTAYKLRLPMLATYFISPDLAEKLLFIGKVVRVLQSKKNGGDTQLLTLSEMQVFSEAFHKLQLFPEFNPVLFSKIIEQVREHVAGKLWELAVGKSDLLAHLRALKQYYLLSKGEFYQLFLEEACGMMALPPVETTGVF